jgi:hypothetical protein
VWSVIIKINKKLTKKRSDFQGRSICRHCVDLAVKSSAVQGRSSSTCRMGSSMRRSGSIDFTSHTLQWKLRINGIDLIFGLQKLAENLTFMFLWCLRATGCNGLHSGMCAGVCFNGLLDCALVQSLPLRAIWCCRIHYIAKCSRITDNCGVKGQGSNSAAHTTAESVYGDQAMLAVAQLSRASHKPFCWFNR